MTSLDLKKAFGTINPSILLLNHYGIRGIISEWFLSHLSGITQSTHIDSTVSSRENITSGVPQGSVIGPLVFLLRINDMHRS